MNVLVIGAGMYVTGRGGGGEGTVLSSLAALSGESLVTRVVIAARHAGNRQAIAEATARVNALLESRLPTEFEPLAGRDLEPELTVLCHRHQFDAAIVALPDDLHGPALRALIRARVPCLVVKPFVPSIREARELIELQQQHGAYGAVEFHKRHDESNLFTKRVLGEGTLGRLLYVSVAYSQRISIPTGVFREWAQRTNIFQYLGVHYVDLLYFLTGYLPRRLTAYGTSGYLKSSGIDTFDSVHVTCEWCHPEQEGECFISHFDTNWVDPLATSAMSDQRFTIVGTGGRLECDQKHRGLEMVTAAASIHPNPYFSEFLPGPDGGLTFGGYGFRSVSQFMHDVRRLRNGEVTVNALEAIRPTFRQAIVSTAVIDAVNQALAAPLSWRHVDDLA